MFLVEELTPILKASPHPPCRPQGSMTVALATSTREHSTLDLTSTLNLKLNPEGCMAVELGT